jgi:hypothetical protein
MRTLFCLSVHLKVFNLLQDFDENFSNVIPFEATESPLDFATGGSTDFCGTSDPCAT